MHFELLANRPQDLPVIARWCFDEWGHTVEGNTFEKTCERIRGKFNRDRVPLHVLAVEEDRAIGTAQLKVRELNIFAAWEYWLGDVYVAPTYRGRGVASAVCRQAQTIAASFGIRRLYLQTERLDGGLYARLGWGGVHQIHRGEKQILIMELELPAIASGAAMRNEFK